jgi:glycosyltransferase involved in cell wall biosynthesis
MISILLPVYNAENFIESSLSSILNSSYKDFKLVIINDGSTDNSEKIIKKFNDERIALYNKSNSGLVQTLNYGIKKCESEIIMRMDADDKIHPLKLEKQLKAFKESKCILLGTEGYLIDNKDDITGSINLPRKHKKIVKSLLNLNSSIIHPSIMIYKSVYERVNYYSNEIKHAEDYDLFLRLSKIGKIGNLNEKLIYLRKNDSNVSHTNSREQILNTLIAKKYYLKNSTDPISNNEFNTIKEKVLKNLFNLLFINIHTKIVKSSYIINGNRSLLIFFKILRKLIKLFI